MSDRIVFFDLETGGLDPERHPAIQFGGVAVEGWRPVGELEVKIHFDPGAADPEALAGNSFDPEIWSVQAIDSRLAVRQIAEFLREHATVPMMSKAGRPWRACQLAGHNAPGFDGPFLRAFFRAHDEFFPGHFRMLDTCQLAMWAYLLETPEKRPVDYKLGTLCAALGIELAEAHDALADARATVELARMLKGGKP